MNNTRLKKEGKKIGKLEREKIGSDVTNELWFLCCQMTKL